MDQNDERINAPFLITPSDTYTTLKLIGKLGIDSVRKFEQEISNLVSQTPKFIVVNCGELTELSSHWIRALLTLEREMKQNERDMRLIRVSPEVAQVLRDEGVNKALKTSASLREALIEVGLAAKKVLNTDFINPFLEATIDVLKIQMQTEAVAGKIYLSADSNKFLGDISGVIGLVSDAFNGSVVISFPQATFLKVMSRMIGETYTELNQEITDGAGEITNIIFGKAKVILNEKGYGLKTALPTVITGQNHSISTLSKGPIVIVPFKTDLGDFFVEICLSE